jgi:DNA-binding NtrC family response regulator
MAGISLIGLPKKDADNFERHFSSVDVKTEILPTLDAAFEKIPADPPSLIVTESTATLEPLRALHDLLKMNAPATPFLVVTSDARSSAALSVMRAGAFDCLARPYNRFQALAAAKRAAFRSGRTLFTEKVVPGFVILPMIA